MAFFFGILQANNIIIAYVFGFLAGMANSFWMQALIQFDGSFSTLAADTEYFN